MKKRALYLAAMLLFFSRTSFATELQGKVEWLAPLTLSTHLAAEVLESPVTAGEEVVKGRVLLQLENSVADAQLAQAGAEVAYRKLLLDEAKSELQRSEELYERTLLADHDLDLARIAHAEAQSGYRKAQAELKSARREVALRRITAPFNARVTERYVSAGETVNGQCKAVPLITLIATGKRLVRLNVEQDVMRHFKVGEVLHISAGGRSYKAPVSAIRSAEGKTSDGAWVVELVVTADSDGLPQVGGTAKVTLP